MVSEDKRTIEVNNEATENQLDEKTLKEMEELREKMIAVYRARKQAEQKKQEEELRRANEEAIARFKAEEKRRLEEAKAAEAEKAKAAQAEKEKSVEVEKEKSDVAEKPVAPDSSKLIAAYARYLKANNLKPGDASFADIEEIEKYIEEEPVQEAPEKSARNILDSVQTVQSNPAQSNIEAKAGGTKAKASNKSNKKSKSSNKKKKGFSKKLQYALAAPIELHDTIQGHFDNFLDRMITGLGQEVHRFATDYRNSRKEIAKTIMSICIISGLLVVTLDYFTVYEYAYNGKVLGYVERQEDVTDVLEVAGEQLNEINTESSQKIEFEAGDNISFKLVDATGKDIDNADTTVNKFAYMTDIEVEAYGIYDGKKLVTIVKSEDAARSLLTEVKGILGTPDEGMELISCEFENPLEIKKVNILLTSVQSNSVAKDQMVNGGKTKYYHLVEKGETKNSIMDTFGVSESQLYNSDDSEKASSFNEGEKICIHKTVDPVSVKMEESGKMREIVKYETVRKKSKQYYKGDEVVKVEGVDGVQIFEGTVTKVGGKVVKRDTKHLDVITKKVDKVILVGTAKRPKTAPTGIFKNPMIVGTYVITSRTGPRWGRTHSGIDMAGPIGTDIFASDGGTVTRASYYAGYGLCVDIQHSNGWITRYGHMSAVAVKAGDKVYQGQYIGDVGNTGHSTGPHLHFEIRHNGAIENPEEVVSGGL